MVLKMSIFPLTPYYPISTKSKPALSLLTAEYALSCNMKNLEDKPGSEGSLAIHSLGLPLPLSQEVVLPTDEVLVSTRVILEFLFTNS